MKLSTGQKVQVGFGLALILLIIVGAASYRSTAGLIQAAEREQHTQEVLGRLNGLLSTITDAETGERGYIITGQEGYLEPFHAAVAVVDQEFKDLRALTANNPNQQRRLSALEPLIARKMALLQAKIDLQRNQGFDAARQAALTGEGKNVMDNIRLFEQLRSAHERLQRLSRRLVEAQETERRRIAHELHDEIGQTLTAVKINLQALQRLADVGELAPRLEESVDMAERALQQVRNLSLDSGARPARGWPDRHRVRAGTRNGD